VSDYIVHAAVEVRKLKTRRRKEVEVPGYLERVYIAQPKYDGCNMPVIFDGETVQCFSRTNEEVMSVEHIKMAMYTFPNMVPGVYLGECWAPDLTFSEINGLFRRQYMSEDSARLQYAIFDYLTLEEWEAGGSNIVYGNRVARMAPDLSQIPQGINPIWLGGSFGHIADTWPGTTAQQVCDKLVAVGGYDGLILRDPYGEWRKGDNGTDGEIIKVKAKVSLDLRVIGYEPGKKANLGKVGSLIVSLNGRPQGAGTGLKAHERDVANFERDWLGKIVEVEALGYSDDGMLREPRMKGIRHDKLEPDA
jgi:DNA ligase-1